MQGITNITVFCKQIKTNKRFQGSLIYFNRTVSKLLNYYKLVVLYFYSSKVIMHCNKQELLYCFVIDLENNFENNA